MAITLAQYRTRISAKLGLTTGSGTEQDLIDTWVNEGYVDFLVRTRCYVDVGLMPAASADGNASWDTDILALLDLTVENDGPRYHLERVSPIEILARRRNNASETSGPARLYAIQGHNFVMFYPTPGDESYVAYYVPRPAALTDSAHTPDFIPSEYHKALEYYALAEGGDYDDDATSQQGDRYRGLYEMQVAQCRRLQNFKGGRYLPPAVVGKRAYIPHDNSADVW